MDPRFLLAALFLPLMAGSAAADGLRIGNVACAAEASVEDGCLVTVSTKGSATCSTIGGVCVGGEGATCPDTLLFPCIPVAAGGDAACPEVNLSVCVPVALSGDAQGGRSALSVLGGAHCPDPRPDLSGSCAALSVMGPASGFVAVSAFGAADGDMVTLSGCELSGALCLDPA